MAFRILKGIEEHCQFFRGTDGVFGGVVMAEAGGVGGGRGSY